jgi:hypothetical protein
VNKDNKTCLTTGTRREKKTFVKISINHFFLSDENKISPLSGMKNKCVRA